jgi:hypothetical protein
VDGGPTRPRSPQHAAGVGRQRHRRGQPGLARRGSTCRWCTSAPTTSSRRRPVSGAVRRAARPPGRLRHDQGRERAGRAPGPPRPTWCAPAGCSGTARTSCGPCRRLAQDRTEVTVVDDQLGRPTYAVDLAQALVALGTATTRLAPSTRPGEVTSSAGPRGRRRGAGGHRCTRHADQQPRSTRRGRPRRRARRTAPWT